MAISYRRAARRASARDNLTFTPRAEDDELPVSRYSSINSQIPTMTSRSIAGRGSTMAWLDTEELQEVPAVVSKQSTVSVSRRVGFEQAYMSFIDAEIENDFNANQGGWWQQGRNIVFGTKAQLLVTAVILLNVTAIGFETDHPDWAYWITLEHAFNHFFTIELVLRIAFSESLYFFSRQNEMFFWNCFSTSMVGTGWLDYFLCGFFHFSRRSLASTSLQCMQLLRGLRIFRILRFAGRLYQMAYGVMLAAMAVFWVTLLMGVALFVCAVILVRTVGRNEESDSGGKFLKEEFGNISEAMFTLFQLVVQPNLLDYEDSMESRPMFALFLVVFVIFGSFGTIALLTGVTGEAMFEKNIIRSESVRVEHEVMLWQISQSLSSLFETIGTTNRDQEASREQLLELVPGISEVFQCHGLNRSLDELRWMLKYMDSDASGRISKAEFCRGVLQMAEEQARPMLLMELHDDSVAYFKARIDTCEMQLDRLRWQHSRMQLHLKEAQETIRTKRQTNLEGDIEARRVSIRSACSTGSDIFTKLNLQPWAAATAMPDCEYTSQSLVVSNSEPLPEDLRGTFRSLSRQVDTCCDSQEAAFNGGLYEELAAHTNCRDRLTGLSMRVGECEFAVREAAADVGGFAFRVTELTRLMNVMFGRRASKQSR